MNFKITTLCENNVAQGGESLIGEHGLSFYIEAEERRILFDTGQNLALVNNAEVLGIDLSRIDTVVSVVLSHGHYDHSGGLKSLLECNKDFTLYAHPEVFGRKVKGTGDNPKYIGIPVDRKALEQKGINVRLDKNPVWIAPDITTTGEIPLENDFETVGSNFTLKNGENYAADTLADDRALILDTDKGSVVLLGCSHRGVVNTLNHVTQIAARRFMPFWVDCTWAKPRKTNWIK